MVVFTCCTIQIVAVQHYRLTVVDRLDHFTRNLLWQQRVARHAQRQHPDESRIGVSIFRMQEQLSPSKPQPLKSGPSG